MTRLTLNEALAFLELPANATWEEVRQQYRMLVKVWHPDRFAGDERFKARCTMKMQQINEAYQFLEEWFESQKPPETQEATGRKAEPVVEPMAEPVFTSTTAPIGIFEALVKFVFLPCIGALFVLFTVVNVYWLCTGSSLFGWITTAVGASILITKISEFARDWYQAKERLLSLFRSSR